MAKYEAVFLFKQEEKTSQKIIEALFKGAKAKVVKKEDWKVKDLAYPIRKQTQAHYWFYIIELEPQNLPILYAKIKLEERVLRSLIIKIK